MRGLKVESYLNTKDIYYKDVEEHKSDINNTIEDMISKNERVVFSVVAERAGIDPFVIRKYPELRTYILQRIKYYKEIKVINNKIDRAVNSLICSNKRVTFMAVIKKCNFKLDTIYQNQYIKDRIIKVIAENN